ncbi:hypothetical protein C9383_24185 [Pseudomonas palleroniana]|uniref:Uncharacterized protein n=1 Tax=Pseudomonas palleroniana TaxID=191390 RepID=A0A2T4FFV3_9PSED|nr:hypothetical protein C9383_24185 [Pseudomonas palleroniana]
MQEVAGFLHRLRRLGDLLWVKRLADSRFVRHQLIHQQYAQPELSATRPPQGEDNVEMFGGAAMKFADAYPLLKKCG